jgi:hypothetical protein
MIFPTMLYKCPGPHSCAGGTFGYIGAVDQAEFDQRIADGWHPTMPEAMNPPVVTPAIVPDDSTPPTREELESKATELGLKFDGRTSDVKLGKMISEAI